MIKLPNWDKVIQEVGQQVFERVQRRTPVRSGRARDGWEIANTDSGVVINNNVPYIGVLDEGTSAQAPQGFTRITFEEIPDILKTALENNINEK